MDNNLNDEVVVQRTSTLSTKKRFFRYGVYYAFSLVIDYLIYNLAFQHYGFPAIPWMILSVLVIDLSTLLVYLHKGIDFFDINGLKDDLRLVAASEPKNIFQRIKKRICTMALRISQTDNQHSVQNNKILKWLSKFGRSSKVWVSAALLSIYFNPFMVTIIMRDGPITKNSLTKKDWKIFWLTFVTGNLYWAAFITGVFGTIFYVLEKLFNFTI